MIKALLFDLDDTLFEYDVAFEGFIKRLAQRFEADLGDEMALIHSKNANGYAPRVEFFDWFAQHYAIQESGEVLWGIMQEDFSNYISVSNSTKKILKGFSKAYRVGILTNGSSLSQRNKIKRTGLGKIVSDIFISGEMECEKPDAEIFRLACKQLDMSPEQTLYIGDHWENDIVGAKSAGLSTCWLQRGELAPASAGVCDFVITSLDDLSTILMFND